MTTHDTAPTTTAPATVLSEDDVTATQAALTSALMDARMGRYLPFVDELAISHRTLAAQVRALEQRRGCRRPATGYTDLATPECEWHEDVEMLMTAIEEAHAKVFPEWGELDGDESAVYLMTQALQRIVNITQPREERE